MAEQKHESRVARLLSAYGVGEGGRYSIRKAAEICGISRTTMSNIMQGLYIGENRRLQKKNLDRISAGLDIPRDLLEREMMADWGYVATFTEGDLASVLAAMAQLSERDLLTLQAEITRKQQSRLED